MNVYTFLEVGILSTGFRFSSEKPSVNSKLFGSSMAMISHQPAYRSPSGPVM
ncbi:Uncharacterised protein [Mycobacteroides abscessus subsp. abscessus]|nr:Uncharacterised protein [Mycobacteroides abscessus subsp. abscessus]